MSLKNESLIAYIDPSSPISESYRILRTNLIYRDFDKEMRVINAISTNEQEGKSTTILNLAAVFAQLGKKVLVIDLDLRIPTVHKKLKYKNTRGITDILSNQIELEEALLHYRPNFDVIFAGTMIPFPSEFVQSSALKKFIDERKFEYDYIFIDCPPIALVTEGVIVSGYCDGTLLVCASNKSEKKELLHAKDLIEQMKINVVGIVHTMVPTQRSYYYGQARSAKTKKQVKAKRRR